MGETEKYSQHITGKNEPIKLKHGPKGWGFNRPASQLFQSFHLFEKFSSRPGSSMCFSSTSHTSPSTSERLREVTEKLASRIHENESKHERTWSENDLGSKNKRKISRTSLSLVLSPNSTERNKNKKRRNYKGT